jgi:hypothetical protein
MPMTTPREMLIVQNIVATLLTVQEVNGYGFNVGANSVVVDPVNIFDVPPTKLPFFIVEPTDDGDRRFEPAEQLFDEFTFTITARVDASGIDGSRRYTVGGQLHADLERVLTADLTRGGLSSDTRLRKPQVYTSLSGDNSVIVVQRGACRVHRTYGEPA